LAVGELRNRKAAPLGDLRIIGIDFRAAFLPHEAWNDEVLKWLPRERHRPEGFQVEITQGHRSVPRFATVLAHAAMGSTHGPTAGCVEAHGTAPLDAAA